MDRLTSTLVPGLAFHNGRLDAGDPAQPPDSALRECVPKLGDVVGQYPVAAFWIVTVELVQHRDELLLFGLTGGDRLFEPFVVALCGESQDPARDRDRHPHWGTNGGHLLDERVDL